MRYARVGLVLGALLLTSACAGQRISSAPAGSTTTLPPREPSDSPAGPSAIKPAVPAPQPSPAVPSPRPAFVPGYEEKGEASWYGNPYHGRRAASGEIYDMNQMTAAHRTLPFDTRVWVESLVDGSGVELRINDRGPFKDPERRIIDVSYAAARLLGVLGPGVIPVRVRVVSLPGAARPASTSPPSASPSRAAPAATTPPGAAASAPAVPPSAPAPAPASPPSTTGAAAESAPAASAPAAPSSGTAPAPVSPTESSPPISPSATPVTGAKDSSAGESAAPRAADASQRETAAAPRETAQAPRETPARLPEAAAAPRQAVVRPPEVAAAPRETATRPRETAAVPREGWSVQLGAYSSEARAVDLARAWPGAYVQKVDMAGRPVWRVRVGRYPTRREAEEAAQRMAAAGHRTLVVEDAAR